MDFTTANPGLRIRKILPGRDNLAIAGLIERSFREFLDPDGRAFIETLRKTAWTGWLDAAAGQEGSESGRRALIAERRADVRLQVGGQDSEEPLENKIAVVNDHAGRWG